jgi:hypothetical protein
MHYLRVCPNAASVQNAALLSQHRFHQPA